jgi:hypothetical protein
MSVVSARGAASSFAHVVQGRRLALPPSFLKLFALLPPSFLKTGNNAQRMMLNENSFKCQLFQDPIVTTSSYQVVFNKIPAYTARLT